MNKNKLYLRLKDVNEFTRLVVERKRIEKELKAARKAAENRDRAKSDFLASMSHELRTPLNHIIGFTELIVDKHFGDLNETQEEYLNDVLTSGRHLLALINDILDLSKVEAGKMELKPEAVPLRSFLENSLVMIKEKAMKHNIALSVATENMSEMITADVRKLKQIIFNLLSNAVKNTPDGGRVTVCARKISETRVVESDEKDDSKKLQTQTKNFIRISVEDSGIGIEPENLEKIFQPFDQVSDSKIKHKGTGLGLSLTQRLVELHGGRIWARSQGKNRGSTFHFTIPD